MKHTLLAAQKADDPLCLGARTHWQRQLADAVRSPAQLLRQLDLPADTLGALHAQHEFPLRVPQSYIDRMRPGDATDPLLRQVLPIDAELREVSGFINDPLQELAANPVPGIVHKYHGRALMMVTQACAVHCRYCFRRHFPYAENRPAKRDEALSYLRFHSDISEVILSGGDPLSLSDDQFESLVSELASIPSLQTLRIHTRLPVVIPDRVTQRLLNMLEKSRFQVVMVLHINHGNEINSELVSALAPLRSSTVTMLNQSVLLKGVNDSVAAQIALSQALFAAGVLPYYLHLLDKVAGAAHFEVLDSQARAIHKEMQARLPGYLLPRLVREEGGEASKTLVPLT